MYDVYCDVAVIGGGPAGLAAAGAARKEGAEKIKVALSFGDLSENSEYDEAKNDQAIVESRIADVGDIV